MHIPFISKKALFSIGVLLAALLAAPTLALAQSQFSLNVHKNVGYDAGSQIRGDFTMSAVGGEKVASVTFLMDGQSIKTVDAPPFELRFNTTDYALGWHDLSAVGHTSGGSTLTAPAQRFEFVSQEQEFAGMGQIMVPILAIVGGLIVIMLVLQFAGINVGKKRQLPLGAARSYGALGGAICPHCKRPFSRHWWGLNMLTGKLDRCEFCGRWSVVRRASPEALAAAEQAELADARPAAPIRAESEEERLRREVDESKYTDEK